MSADEVNKRIYDVLLSIDDIKEFTVNIKGIQEFKNDKIVKVAVERKLEIIGEALNRILKLESNIAISSTKEIIGMRNRIVHAYDNIDDNFIWVAIKKHLPILEEEIKELIKIRNIEI